MSFVSLLVKPKIVTLTSARCDAPSYNCIPPERSVPLTHLSAFAKMGGVPSAYLSWLICEDYDAFDVGHALTACDYSGPCIFVSPDLPNTAMVLRELVVAFPRLAISLWPKSDAPLLAEAFCAALIQAEPVVRRV
ncbi:hypothetical protein [Lentibacter sp.]|uniref:hypothetical protein n=1 Tax=Lentibacter sp. TaxID=2024994 RepID=UPI003F6A93E1